MSPIDLRNPGRPIRVGVILFNTYISLNLHQAYGFYLTILD